MREYETKTYQLSDNPLLFPEQASEILNGIVNTCLMYVVYTIGEEDGISPENYTKALIGFKFLLESLTESMNKQASDIAEGMAKKIINGELVGENNRINDELERHR